MRKIVALAILVAFVLQSCRKENSAVLSAEDQAQASIEIDGETLDIIYSGNEINQSETYTFLGSAGYYYGISSFFKMSEKENLRIIFGTLLTDTSSLTEQALLKLVKKGERSFGSLGAFSSYPKLDSDKVEIAFVDNQSRQWCSTRISERNADYGLETTVDIHQPDGQFIIDNIERVYVKDEGAFRVRGSFKCFMYEVNGKKKKKMSGKFVGIMRLED